MKSIQHLRSLVDWWEKWINSSDPSSVENPPIDQIKIDLEKEETIFPNGFDSWMDTFYQISQILTDEYDYIDHRINVGEYVDGKERKLWNEVKRLGKFYLRDLSQNLTNNFEILNKGREWDGEWLEELETFVKDHIS